MVDSREVRPIPEGYHTVTPWTVGRDTDGLIRFFTEAFGAEEIGRMMVDKPDWSATPGFLRLYVEDARAAHDGDVAAGGTSVTEPTHLSWGNVVGRVADPFGNLYWVQQRIEDITEDEMARRVADPVFVENLDYVQDSLVRPDAR